MTKNRFLICDNLMYGKSGDLHQKIRLAVFRSVKWINTRIECSNTNVILYIFTVRKNLINTAQLFFADMYLKIIRLLGISDLAETDFDVFSKIIFLNITIGIGIFFLTIFSIVALINGDYKLASADFSVAIIQLIVAIYLNRTRKYTFASHLIVTSLGLLFIYLIITGGSSNSGFLWSFLFPIGATFLYGRKLGLMLSAVFILIVSILLFFEVTEVLEETSLKLRYLGTFAALTGIAYFFDYVKKEMEIRVQQKNIELAGHIIELQAKDKALMIEKKKAEQADMLKSEFLAQMSHEIRTPINTILNYTSLLKNEFENRLPEDLKGSFESITNASRRLIRTIDMVLDLSAIESGSYELLPENIYLIRDIIAPIISEFSQSAVNKKINLSFINNYNDDLLIRSDRYSLTQILTNLIDNSIKYTHQGEVKVMLSSDIDRILLTISDTGIGISQEYLPKLFEKFSQEGHGYSRPYEGSGLGLTLVKNYCELNNIKIEVESIKNKGTAFTLVIPSADN